MLEADGPAREDTVAALQRRLARERAARLEAEAIAERATSELYETIQKLRRSTMAELLGRVAVQANEADSVLDALSTALVSVCDYTGWVVGHAFVRSPEDPGLLITHGAWHTVDDVRYEPFRLATEGTRFRSGDGLPGRVLASGRAIWIDDLAADPGFLNQDSAATCGLAGGFAAPVLVRSETVAVLEFFTTTVQPPDEDVLRTVGFVAAQLARVIEREAAEERLIRQALYDGLTGLPNRVLLMDRLRSCLARTNRTGQAVSVLFLDIDDFKTINDSRGHAEGDAVLAALAQRLQNGLRTSDSMGRVAEETVARLAGDEFAVILEECSSVAIVTTRIQELLSHPLLIGDHEVFVGVSIGSVALSALDHSASPGDVLAAANLAMHQAKQGGKGRHVAYEPWMQDEARRRDALGVELHRAVDRHEFRVLYQPVVDLATGAVIGAEALVRWQHPVRGLLAPDDFVARAEETGLIVPMGRWVLEQACRQAASWRGAGASTFTVAVNVSGRQLRQPEFVPVVRRALRDAGLEPPALCLEMTESTLMERDDAAIAMLAQLRVDGMHLAIDDFGTGFSSLAALRRLPVDLLKIDRSFVASLPGDDDAGTIAWAVVRLGHTLGLTVLAEGVESEEQRTALLSFGCDHAQGYLFGRPMTAEQLGRLLLP